MTRTVFTGQEIPHLFAADKNAYARNSNGSLFCESGRLYSYRRNAPIAAWFGDIVLLNADSYSVTTSKHQRWTQWAVRHLETVTLPDLRAVLENASDKGRAEYIAKRAAEIDALKEAAKKLRADHTKANNARQIENLEKACAFVWNIIGGKKTPWRSALAVKAKADKADHIRRYTAARNQLESGAEDALRRIIEMREKMESDRIYAESRGMTPRARQDWWSLDNCRSDIMRIDAMSARHGRKGVTGSATLTHAAKLMGAKWADDCTALALGIVAIAETLTPEIDAARAEFERLENISAAETRAAWVAGGRETPQGDTICRVVGDVVETSRGAKVPLIAALALVALASQCRANGLPMNLKGRQIGAYRADRIDVQGGLQIGCHHIKWEAIADCVARYEESKA